ncbi:MAG: biotin transporter BioY, partial [Oscillospiraceae bacterium]|nr:biotin transporter BioY [Oscillospiraceae bacterium]
MQNMQKMKLSIRDICLIGVFAAIIAVMSQLRIPMPYGVPMTLQTLAVPLAGIVLGAKKGALATLVYILLGAVGAPVFSGFTGGIGVVIGMTGGFILSFPLMALVAGLAESKKSIVWLASGLVAGAAINYLCGALWFSLVMSSSIITAFAACVQPFILTDVIKITLLTAFASHLKNALIKASL